jgi:oxaloacetate decarboxylase
MEDRVPFRLSKGPSPLLPTAEQVGKLEAAVAARRDPSTVIVARSGAFKEVPREEAVARVKAYAQAGVDAIMLPGLAKGRDDIKAVREVTDLPLCVLNLGDELSRDDAFLAAYGVRVRYLNQPVYSMAVRAIYDCLVYLKEGRSLDELKERMASRELLDTVIRTDEMGSWGEKYIRS